MSRVERDPERGRAVAAELGKLGVKGILIQAAEQGYITELACQMPKCFCPEELGGACHFEPVTDNLSDWRSDWMPTHEHFPRSKREGGHRVVDNAVLAHRLCNRIGYSIEVDRPHARDLARIQKAREERSAARAKDRSCATDESDNRDGKGANGPEDRTVKGGNASPIASDYAEQKPHKG